MTSPNETPLTQRLMADPGDWNLRIALLDELVRRGAFAEACHVLFDAPAAAGDESQLHRVVDLTHSHPECAPGLRQVIAWFIGANPDSGYARLLQAQVTFRSGDHTTALAQYRAARRRDAAINDPDLDALHAAALAKVAASVIPAAASVALKESAGVSPEPVAAPPHSTPLPIGNDHNLVLQEGEMVHARQKDPDTREKLTSVTVAVVAHIVIGILLGWMVIAQPRPKPPQIVSTQVAEANESALDKPEIEKARPTPVQMASAQTYTLAANAFSNVAMPPIDSPLVSVNPLGLGDSFGPSMSFGMGKDGGSVSFFGAKSVSKKVVFVVDFSVSMGGERDILMRKELAKSIEALPNGVQYQVILFAGPAWYAGQEVGKAGMHDKFVANTVKDGSLSYVWYEGWDEQSRHSGNGMTALYHFSGGKDRLPKASYITASRSSIRQTIQQIEATPLVFGTEWRWPLMMAMNLKPDTIYFMTDGAFGTGSGVTKKEMIDSLLDHNRKNGNARINTICMMVLQAKTELEQLAKGTGGEFTLVKEDGSVVRGGALNRLGE